MEQPSLPDISSFAAPVYVVLILVEVLLILKGRARGDYETRDTATSLAMGTGNLTFGLLFAGSAYAAIDWIYEGVYASRVFDIGFAWWAFIVAFVAYDFIYYWSHRLQHTIRWGWANHVIHHSSQHYNLSTALRQPWFSFVSGYFVLALPLAAIGFPPALVAFVASLNLFYQFFIHTETVGRLHPWVEAVMNTPSHHRVHHGKNAAYLDANYAGTFIVWDRLFGTFVPEDDAEPVRYGLVRDIGTFNPLKVAVHEYVGIFRDATAPGLTFGERLKYIFMPPGWSHDNSRLTSSDIKRRAGHLDQDLDAKEGASMDAPFAG